MATTVLDALTQIVGLDAKNSVRLATTAALPANTYSGATKRLTATANGALSVDSITVVVGDRVLIKNEVAGANNGIYKVIAAGDASNPYILERSVDFDSDADIMSGCKTSIQAGTTNEDSEWQLTTNEPITMDTTALVFASTGAGAVVAGTGLTKTGNTLDVISANGGIVANNDNIALTLDGATLTVGATGIKISAGGVGATELAAAAAGDGIAGGAGSAFSLDIVAESFVGTGAQTAFVLANTPMTNGEFVFYGGLLQKKGAGHDYTISGNTITFAVSPVNGSNVEIRYFK